MILVIGSEGQLGRQMKKLLTEKKIDFIALDYPDIDITNICSVKSAITNKYSCVINCAAYTNVDKAEIDEEQAYRVNALGSRYIAQACSDNGIEMVHISTDYVFSGEAVVENGVKRGYIETDECNPTTVYGKTKYAGEEFVREATPKHYILRTAWLYGDGNNFVRTMLKLADSNNNLRIVSDQIGSPTSTVDLSNAILSLIGSGKYGTFHATCEGRCSWYEFAKKIFEYSNMYIQITPVKSEEFLRPAKRPKWSVLENCSFIKCGMNIFRNWEEALREYLQDYYFTEVE